MASFCGLGSITDIFIFFLIDHTFLLPDLLGGNKNKLLKTTFLGTLGVGLYCLLLEARTCFVSESAKRIVCGRV